VDYVDVLYNDIPTEAWGSEDKVDQWLKDRMAERTQEEL
jgi:hypothetical protein